MEVNKIINERIYDNKLIVIDSDGKNLGPMFKNEAISLAREQDLDLVLIVPNKGPNSLAVAKIMDFSKYAYEQKRKDKHAKKNQTVVKVKEIKVRPQIGIHDMK
jgi:translation initiation factor IF-3